MYNSHTRLPVIPLFCSLLLACQSVEQPELSEPAPSAPDPVRVINEPEPDSTETAPSVETVQPEPEEAIEAITSVWQRIRSGFQFQDQYSHPSVEQQLSTYRENQRFFDLIAQRAEPFLFSIAEEIAARELPMELALLPIVESTFDPSAHSHENAAGLWQFLGPTARELGLKQDWWYDGRRDPMPSTRAALDYLETLHQQFDQDWLLALAAYNTGSSNLNRALRRNAPNSSEFWELPLASETRTHVPKLLALARIVSTPQDYGIELPEIANHNPLSFVDVGAQIDLARVATLIEIDTEELRALNPAYLQWTTHPESPQRVAVPEEKAQQLRAGLANLDRSEFVAWEHYRIRSGDTLGGIARRLNTTTDVLEVVNRLDGTRIIAGHSLLIPRGSGAGNYSALVAPTLVASTSGQTAAIRVPASYEVRSGDNLWSIARKFDLRSREIAAHNQLDLDALLQPGQVLELGFAYPLELAAETGYAGGADQTYRVRRGDSMARIAERFTTELDDLLQWNDLSATDLIFPGQLVRITAP